MDGSRYLDDGCCRDCVGVCMMGVNDVKSKWRGLHEQARLCAQELEQISDAVWHPVSEPPTEVDGDELGHVLVMHKELGSVIVCPWDVAATNPTDDRDGEKYCSQWARIKDVVLMPPEE